MSEKKEAQQMTVELIGDERECLEYIKKLKQEYKEKEKEFDKKLKSVTFKKNIGITLFVVIVLSVMVIMVSSIISSLMNRSEFSVDEIMICLLTIFLAFYICLILPSATFRLPTIETEQEYITEKMGGDFYVLYKASQSRKLRSVIFTPTNEPDRTDISLCIEQDNKFVTYEKFKNVHTLATSEDDNKSKFYIRFGIGVEKLQIIRHCDESLPVGVALKVI